MKALFFFALLTVFLFPTKAFSHLDDEFMALGNVMRKIGWMQAACSFYDLGYMSKSSAQIVLEATIQNFERENSNKMADRATKSVIQKYPNCSEIMP